MTTHLKIGRLDADELAKKLTTPLYVYDARRVEENYLTINSAIFYEPKQIHYAIMCNNRLQILKVLLNLGADIQVNSVKEYRLVKSIGSSNAKISVTTTNISTDDLSFYAENQAQINFDSIEEISCYGQLIKQSSTVINHTIGIRISVPMEITDQSATNQPHPTKARVGINSKQFDLVKEAAKKYNLKINGIHGYIASNLIDLVPFIKLGSYLVECAKKFPDLEYINFGTGFGIDFDWLAYGQMVTPLMRSISTFFGRPIHLKIEPGRSLVGDAGILLTRVTNIKDMGNWTQVGVDAGFGVFARPYIYGWQKGQGGYHPVVVANKIDQPPKGLYTICGNSTLQGDFIAEDRLLPEIEIGDLIAILNAGAYGAVMLSGFPGMRRAGEVLIYDDTIEVISETER